jgi:hypothetical protein
VPANRRWDAKRDANEPDVIAALERAGCGVWRDLPVDLLIRVPGDPPGVLRCMEVKMPGANPGRKDRKRQHEFCIETGAQYVTTPEEALAAVGVDAGGGA